jgi:tetratricopeptide (TPR) repeat protein
LQELEVERKKVAIERVKRNRARMIAAVASIYAFDQAAKAREATADAIKAKNDALEAEKRAKKASFDVLTGQGFALQKEGKHGDAVLKYEDAMKFAETLADSATVDSLIGLSCQNVSRSQLFGQFMAQAETDFASGSYAAAFGHLNQAASNITSESNRSRVDLKRKEFENELSKKVNEYISKAKNYKLINRCDLVNRELQKIENIRAFVSLSPAEAATLTELKDGC